MAMQKFDFIKNYFLERNFIWKTVLDAWTGKTSALFLAEKQPEKLVLLAYEWDKRKWESTEKALIENWFNNYQLLYGDISKENMFEQNSFDFIFADYLLWEVAPSKLSNVFKWISKFFKKDGEAVFIDRDFYKWYEPSFNYISMSEITWLPELEKRTPRDLVEIIDTFMIFAKVLKLFNQEIRSFDYPSDWVISIIRESGLTVKDIQYFEIEQPIKEEFEQRIVWARWRINSLDNKGLAQWLLSELDKVEKEFNKRNIKADECYLRKHYLIVCKK